MTRHASTNWDALAASAPLDRKAATVAGRGDAAGDGETERMLAPPRIVAAPSDPGFTDLTGQRAGRLTVLGYTDAASRQSSAGAPWACRCDCGDFTIARSKSIRACQRGDRFPLMCARCHHRRAILEGRYHGATRRLAYVSVPISPKKKAQRT